MLRVIVYVSHWVGLNTQMMLDLGPYILLRELQREIVKSLPVRNAEILEQNIIKIGPEKGK